MTIHGQGHSQGLPARRRGSAPGPRPRPRGDALHEAYEVIINARAARREALRYGECVFEGLIKKEPKGGFGLTVCERKEGGVAIKRVVFWSCATCVERPEGIERELPSSELSFRAGDRIVGVDGDDTRRWSVTRLIQRLDNFRVPAEASILLRVARPVLLDAHAEPRRPSRAEPSPRPSARRRRGPSVTTARRPPSRDEGAPSCRGGLPATTTAATRALAAAV